MYCSTFHGMSKWFVHVFEKFGWMIWKQAMMSRKMMNAGNAKVKNFALNYLFKKSWGNHRSMPVVASKSFNQMWSDKQKPKAN